MEGDIETRVYNDSINGEVKNVPEICVRRDGMSTYIEKLCQFLVVLCCGVYRVMFYLLFNDFFCCPSF